MSENTSARSLTVALIVRNDSQPLADSLQSVASLADEIIVLDTGSSDDSLQVAQRAGARVFSTEWANDFAAARNECVKHATGEWVLWLDCGETLSTADADQLRQFIDSEADTSKAYMMLVTTPEGTQGEAAEQIGRIRLVPRLPGVQFAGRVRESLDASLIALGMLAEGLPMRIQRGQREHDRELKWRRARRDLVLAEQEIKESGADPRLLLTLGEALRNLNQTQQAAEMFRHAVHRSEAGSSEMLEGYYGTITTMTEGTEEALAQRVASCLEALETYPLDAQLLCALGGFLVQQGNVELGVRSFETAIQHGQMNPTVCHLVEIQAVAAICAATALASREQHAEAKAFLEQALADDPENARLQARLAELESQVTATARIAS